MSALDVPVERTRVSRSWVLVGALALTGFSMRTSVTSVGAALDDIEHGLHTNSGVAGLLTTLPVVCFAGLGSLAPRMAARVGPHRMVTMALAITAVGLATRALVSDIWLFLLLSVLALSGGAIANVLLPTLVKQHFPDRIGRMTAVYTTALAVGTTAAAGLTVPLASAGGSWRVGIGAWAVFAAVAVLPWLPTLRHDVLSLANAGSRISAIALLRSRTAWALTIFFATQSMGAYIAFGWFARFLHAHGISEGAAGWMVALLSAIGIPISMIAPNVPARHFRAMIAMLTAAYVVAYVGLGLAPVGGAWVWMVFTGIGSGMFPVALTMIGMRTRTAETTAALSAFMQSIGYLVAGTGPLLFGVLYGVTGSWIGPLAMLWIALVVAFGAGWIACAPRFVDDEIGPRP